MPGQLSDAHFTNVPYKGQSQIMTDIGGRQLDCAPIDLGGAMTSIQGGKLRALAVTGVGASR